MKKLLGMMSMVILLSGDGYADNIFNGTFIDAHSQVGNLISGEELSLIHI